MRIRDVVWPRKNLAAHVQSATAYAQETLGAGVRPCAFLVAQRHLVVALRVANEPRSDAKRGAESRADDRKIVVPPTHRGHLRKIGGPRHRLLGSVHDGLESLSTINGHAL